MKLGTIFSILIMLNTLDYYLTLYNVNNGAREGNILLQGIIQNGLAFMLVKIVLVIVILTLLFNFLQKKLSELDVVERMKNVKICKVAGYILATIYAVTVMNNIAVIVCLEGG